jgi:hypothetical protein
MCRHLYIRTSRLIEAVANVNTMLKFIARRSVPPLSPFPSRSKCRDFPQNGPIACLEKLLALAAARRDCDVGRKTQIIRYRVQSILQRIRTLGLFAQRLFSHPANSGGSPAPPAAIDYLIQVLAPPWSTPCLAPAPLQSPDQPRRAAPPVPGTFASTASATCPFRPGGAAGQELLDCLVGLPVGGCLRPRPAYTKPCGGKRKSDLAV